MAHHYTMILVTMFVASLGLGLGISHSRSDAKLEARIKVLETRSVATGYDADGKLVFEPVVTTVELENKP